MTYVALLRGINVGGNRKVEMAKLKLTFERLGLMHVKTFIASGNVVYVTDDHNEAALTSRIEAAIEADFGFPVATLLRNLDEIAAVIKTIPEHWVTDKVMKCDVLFLWPTIDSPDVLKQIPTNPEIEDLFYVPGAAVNRIDRSNATKGRVAGIIGTNLYKQMTVRNANSVRKIYNLMLTANSS